MNAAAPLSVDRFALVRGELYFDGMLVAECDLVPETVAERDDDGAPTGRRLPCDLIVMAGLPLMRPDRYAALVVDLSWD